MSIQRDETDFNVPGKLVSVLARMITVDLLKIFIAVMSVLLLILISKQFASILSKAFEGQISNETIFVLLSFKLMTIAIKLFPSVLFASILIMLGRMYRDNEMAALGSGGVGMMKIYGYVFLFVIPLTLVASALSFQLKPWLVEQTTLTLLKERETADIRLLVAGRFNEYSRGDIVFYVESIDDDDNMHNIFVQDRKGNKLNVVLSKTGFVEIVDGARFLVLQNGKRYQGIPGQADFEITQFSEYAVRVGETTNIITGLHREAKPSLELFESSDPKDIVEFQQRLSIPLGMLILTILAIPIARASPRGGIYGNIALAFLIFLIYKNTLSIAQSWIIDGKVDTSIGFWWVYGLMLILALFIIIRQLGLYWCCRIFTEKTSLMLLNKPV